MAAPEELDVPGVQVVSRNGARWHLSVRGDLNPIVRALAQYDLDDFVMAHPRLEDIFMDYYQQSARGRGRGAVRTATDLLLGRVACHGCGRLPLGSR